MLSAIFVWMPGALIAKLGRAGTCLRNHRPRLEQIFAQMRAKEPAPLMLFALTAVAGIFMTDCYFGGVPNGGAPSRISGLEIRHVAVFSTFYAAGIWLVQGWRCCLILVVFFTASLLHCDRDCFSKEREFFSSLSGDSSVVVGLIGKVSSIPRLIGNNGKSNSCQFRFRVYEIEGHPCGVHGGFDLLVYFNAPPPRCGDILKFRAQVLRFPHSRNPGEFDAAAFYRREGLWVQAILPRGLVVEVVRSGSGFSFLETVERVRLFLSEHLKLGLEDRLQTHALLSSMVLGVHSDCLLDARESFVNTGTLHLFAVSGLNLTMLCTMLVATLRVLRVKGRMADLTVFLMVFSYAIATGLGPSCLRAIVMGGLVLLAEWISRPALLMNSLGAAALVSLLFDTNAVFRLGFQLSFGLVAGLALFGRPLAGVIAHIFNPDELVPRPLWKDWQWRRVALWRPFAFAIAAGVSSWISILPWSIFLLHQLTPIALLVNLLVVPIAFLNLALAFISLLCAPFLGCERLAGIRVGVFKSTVARLNSCNGWIADGLLFVVEHASKVPYGNIWVRNPFRGRPEFTVFDVGEGGAVLLNDGTESWLVDCGSGVFAKSVVVPAMRAYGVNAIAGMILSHGDSAHLGGADFINSHIRVGAVMHSCLRDRSPLWRSFEHKWMLLGNPVSELVAGDDLRAGKGSSIEVLYPPEDLHAPVADDRCIVLRWNAGFGSVLYTADSGFTAERWLLEHRRAALQSDVWVRGVHGSDFSGTDEFVKAVRPQLVVVSESRAIVAGSKIEDWVRRCRDSGVSVWMQRDCGAVEGFSTAEGIRCVGFLGGSCLLPVR